MNQKDPAHRLKYFIKHNADPDIIKGAGSSIFFHIWRDGGARSSYGCTVMAEESLRELIAWVDPRQKPLYVLLPKEVYEEKRQSWGLP
jgi:L,D-peptidoglycan transpeptidase YkuD (ErfK/YbiS/YcfS/YnhG family)